MKASLFFLISIFFFLPQAEAQVQKYDADSEMARQLSEESGVPINLIDDKIQQMLSLTEKTNLETKKIGSEDNSCLACQFTYAGTQKSVEFENLQQCGPNRSYLEPQFAEFIKKDPTKSYVKTRKGSELKGAEIPRKCVTYIMRSFLEASSQLQATDSIAVCPKGAGVPRQGAYKACVTENYVNLMYNSFVDVTDCLGLPQKSIVPKFLLESGFNMNAFGAFRVLDSKDGSLRNLLDVRVCHPPGSKISDLSELTACKPEQAAQHLQKLSEAKKKLSSKELANWQKSNEVSLRDIFDFKAADNSWFEELTSQLRDPKKCSVKFIEKFCGHDVTIIGGDTGVGQFTSAAADEASKKWKESVTEVKTSKKESCQRIAKIPGVFDSVSSDINKRCDLIRLPPNPITALLMYGAFFKAQQLSIQRLWDAKQFRGRSIEQMMKEAKIDGFDKGKIIEILTVMAYNSGPSEPIVMFGTWLDSRLQNIKDFPITKSDFDFSQPLLDFYNRKSPEQVNAMSREFKKLSTKSNKTKNELVQLEKYEAARINHLDFSNYLKVYRAGSAKGYLKYVKDAADRLDSTFGKGICTSEKFLSL